MEKSTSLPAAIAARFRDDYGATSLTQPITSLSFRLARSFPVGQSNAVAAIGGQYHAV